MSADLGHHYIGSAWIGDSPNGSAESINPSDGRLLGTAPLGSKDLASQAVLAAREAFQSTNWTTDPRRATMLASRAMSLGARLSLVRAR